MSAGIVKAFLPGSGISAAGWTIQNENRVRSTATLSGFVDTSEDSIDTGTFIILTPDKSKDVRSLRWKHLPSDRHNGGANISFLDGHVGHRKWLHRPKVKKGNAQSPQNERDLLNLIFMAESKPLVWWEPGTYDTGE